MPGSPAPRPVARCRGDLWAIPDLLAEARGCSLQHAQRLYRRVRPVLIASEAGANIQSLRFPRRSGKGLSAPVDCAPAAILKEVQALLPMPKKGAPPPPPAPPASPPDKVRVPWEEAALAGQIRRCRGGYYCAADAVGAVTGRAPQEAARLYWLVKQAHASPSLLATARLLAFPGTSAASNTYVDCYPFPSLAQVLQLALALAAPATAGGTVAHASAETPPPPPSAPLAPRPVPADAPAPVLAPQGSPPADTAQPEVPPAIQLGATLRILRAKYPPAEVNSKPVYLGYITELANLPHTLNRGQARHWVLANRAHASLQDYFDEQGTSTFLPPPFSYLCLALLPSSPPPLLPWYKSIRTGAVGAECRPATYPFPY